jgi:hypothetical protein
VRGAHIALGVGLGAGLVAFGWLVGRGQCAEAPATPLDRVLGTWTVPVGGVQVGTITYPGGSVFDVLERSPFLASGPAGIEQQLRMRPAAGGPDVWLRVPQNEIRWLS